ncbi:hypothetical protein ACQF36_44655 [Streptomyces sp. Marseille-Q5077]|uniref:hypothetical protein n=1 Tax=Streptomyces sp. Marseille-Q5077 TaxID=3418995 RepID=UPI003D03AA0A
MKLGDSLAEEALTTGCRVTRTTAPPDMVRLIITLPDGSLQHFERPTTGGTGDWRAADLEAPGSGFAFNEPITSEWGQGLDHLAHSIRP